MTIADSYETAYKLATSLLEEGAIDACYYVEDDEIKECLANGLVSFLSTLSESAQEEIKKAIIKFAKKPQWSDFISFVQPDTQTAAQFALKWRISEHDK